MLPIPSTPFPKSNDIFPFSSSRQNSSNHSLAHTVHLTAPADLAQIPDNPPENETHPTLLAITQYTPLITNHSTSLLVLQQPIWTGPQPEQKPHTFLTLYRPHLSYHPCIIFFHIYHFNLLFVYTFSFKSFTFRALTLIFNLPSDPPSLSSSNFLLKTSYSSLHPIPLSSLSFFTTAFNSWLSSIPSNLLPNNTFFSSPLSSSFLHPRCSCTANPSHS